MPRYRLIIEYDGAPFCGWQVQDNLLTVQGVIEQAIFATTGENVRVYGAGRTDAGVHARGQVAHVDLIKEMRPDRLRDAINAHARPHPVAVLAADIVPDTFEARFSAIRRHYVYRLINRRADLTVELGRAWRIPRKLKDSALWYDGMKDDVLPYVEYVIETFESRSAAAARQQDRVRQRRQAARVGAAREHQPRRPVHFAGRRGDGRAHPADATAGLVHVFDDRFVERRGE